MSYLDNLSREGLASSYLAVITVKTKIEDTWVLHSGSIYKVPFSTGYVSGADADGEILSPFFSVGTMVAGSMYYDSVNEYLYVWLIDSGDPNSSFVVAYWDYYASTDHKIWHRDPLDESTEEIYWNPVIAQSPVFQQSSSDILYGYLPVQTSAISIINSDHFWEPIIYGSSFNKSPIRIYHQVGDLDSDNIKLVYNGLMSDVSYTGGTIEVSCVDSADIFSNEYRQVSTDDSFFSEDTFGAADIPTSTPGLDPNFIGAPIRTIIGDVKGFTPVNISYVTENPTTSHNRSWVVCNDAPDLVKELVFEVNNPYGLGTPGTTTTTGISGSPLPTSFNKGGFNDIVYFDRVSGTDELQLQKSTFIDIGFGQAFSHSALASPMADGDHVYKSWIKAVYIVQDGVVYTAGYKRDFINADFAGGTTGFTFTSGMESNIGLPRTLSPSDKVFCDVSGRPINNVTDFILHVLDKAGIPSADIDDTTILANERIIYDYNDPTPSKIGFAIPSTAQDSFPTLKTLLVDALLNNFSKLYIDSNGLWTTKLIDSYSKTDSVDDLDIVKGSIEYSFSYADMVSSIVLDYGFTENSLDGNFSASSYKKTGSSQEAILLHGVDKQKTFRSLYNEAGTILLLGILANVYFERSGRLKITTNRKLFNANLGSTIEVNRTKLPGFEYSSDTLRQRNFYPVTITKTPNGVELILDDQKGI